MSDRTGHLDAGCHGQTCLPVSQPTGVDPHSHGQTRPRAATEPAHATQRHAYASRPLPYGRVSEGRGPNQRYLRAGFTLIELMVAVAIIVLLLAIIAAAWRPITESNIEAKALNTINSFAAVARAYAMRHQLETVLTVNPRSGQLDLFVWDTVGDATVVPPIPPNSRYVYTTMLDDTARLPNRGDPTRPDNLDVRIVPIDYAELKYTGPDARRTNNNLAMFALCFNPQGRVVTRRLTLVYELDSNGKIPNPPLPDPPDFRGRVIGLLPGWVAGNLPIDGSLQDDDEWWFQLDTSRGGIAYVAGTRTDLPYDPGTVDNALTATRFMVNQYSGRAVVQEVAG